jgi:outer membrane receptor protein involved in Fe transport
LLSSVDQAVGVYVDAVYAPRSQGLLAALFDVEQVEVVRGPQGTLFGKNTIGGAINVVTRKPDFDPEASARIGNFDRLGTRLSVNVPLIPERAAARFSVATHYDDGYQKNALLDQRPGNDRFLGARGQLMLLATPDVEILLSGTGLHLDSPGAAAARCGPQRAAQLHAGVPAHGALGERRTRVRARRVGPVRGDRRARDRAEQARSRRSRAC